jgi:mono/diheme cytochrome c family protein
MAASKRHWLRIVLTTVAVLLVLAGLLGFGVWYYLFREEETAYGPDKEPEHYKYASIGTENQDGIPYWIWMILPRVFPEKLPGPGGYTSLGLTWEEGKEMPVGFTKKTIGFERVGINCAACHTATYRVAPQDRPVIVPAGPSNKFDSQAYLRFLSACASDPRFNADNLLQQIYYNHKFSLIEGLLYRYVLIPQTKKALIKQQEEFAWTNSRPRWGPGRIDPFNPVKFRVLKMPLDDTIGNSDMMPIWNRKVHQGQSLHWDGLETSLVETIRTGAIGDGATKKSINLSGLERVQNFITELPPPAYPFAIDQALAARGKELFVQQSCNACHATDGKRIGQVIPVDEPGLGTDRHRLAMWTKEAADKYNQFAQGYPWAFHDLRKVVPEGYQAVLLDGLWLRAPYLHNGSVPSLTDLLNAEDARPKKFFRGYDVYDPAKVGFVSEGPEAARIGYEYDTSLPGNGNQGHTYGTSLTPEEKRELVEYLKTL